MRGALMVAALSFLMSAAGLTPDMWTTAWWLHFIGIVIIGTLVSDLSWRLTNIERKADR